MVFVTRSPEETFNLGKQMGESAKAGQVFCLCGDLAMGKTVFAKGFGLGLGISDIVSPSFAVLIAYEQARLPFYHFDLYRLSDPDELFEIGLEFLGGDGVALVEWADLAADLMPPDGIWIHISGDEQDFEYRRIEVEGLGFITKE